MITRFVVTRREIFARGHEFGVTGAYEKLAGKAYGEVDPESPLDRVIVNLDKAPRNRRGRVEYASDFCILKPLDMARGNGRIFFDAPNRGAKRALTFLNDARAADDPRELADAGNGFLMRRGYTIVWCGWQGDLVPGKGVLALQVPVATDGGSAIVRPVRAEIVVTEPGILSRPLSGDERVRSYETATFDKSRCRLTVRKKSYGERVAVPPAQWEFAAAHAGRRLPVQPSAADLYLRSGFRPGFIYELVYPAKNPLVLGLGFAAVRDFVSFLRYGVRDRTGRANPLAGAVRYAYGWGRSQSGRYLRDFVYHGFNRDESGRKVFDAVAPHAAGGGRLFLNYEFARPVTSSQQHTDQLDPELFPFAYGIGRDPQSGRKDGILKRQATDPYVIHTQTSTEYWQKRGCLVHTDGRGRDAAVPEKARIYLIASAQHNSPAGAAPGRENTRQRTNPLPAGEVLRALIDAMDSWVSRGIPPPPSRYPTVRAGTLVPPDRKSTGFPEIPGVRYHGLHNRQLFLDYGPNLRRGRIDFHPPRPIGNGAYRILVPKVDADGNDIAGIRLPAVSVPVGTYTGWNLQSRRLAEDELAGLLGSFIPFARTRRERLQAGDPRASLRERYGSRERYLREFARAARRLVEERYLLPEDAERLIVDARAKVPYF
ncbi:MAG TPA: alpha/beta hydrolase domain-containing protein [candidate division Zixibacteria bacterium]|nr:alpha/beta hydrolase domain-containing protein [candidate division Zixibacteria bacterium]